MSGHSHDNMAPPAAIKAAGVLVVMALLLVVLVRTGLIDGPARAADTRAAAQTMPTAERLLHFRDRDGQVVITDARSGADVSALGREVSGFVRGVMRGLARERRLHGHGMDAPFRLAAWPDGTLSLTDDTTGRVLELASFGPDNRAAFARLLARSAR